VVARAQQAGLNLAARQMFRTRPWRNCSRLPARIAESRRRTRTGAGEVPLTPIQRWFFAQEFEANDHWNIAVLLGVA
jgi:hypothetical protein